MFRILHLSDLHARESTEWSTTPILKQAKNAILEQAGKENIDLVVFTGDIAFSGKKEEYGIAQAWLDELCLNTSGLNLQRGQLLFVPGNHDADRKLITPSAGAIEESLKKATTQATVAFYYDDEDSKKTLLKRHTAYFEFCASFLRVPSGASQCWSQTFKTKSGGRIRVDGLNTSWLCRGDDDHRRLLVGQSQLTEVIKAHTEAVKTHGEPDVRITLMHHPIADLMEFDEDNTADHLKQNTDIVLRGHLHKAGSMERTTNTGTFLELAAGALHDTHESPNRFSILDISDDLSVLRVSTFIWNSGRWILDRNLYETEDGIGIFPFKKKLERDAGNKAITSIRGLLAASDREGPSATDADGAVPTGISSSVPRFEQAPSGQDLAIRQRLLEDALSRLHANRQVVVQKEPGSKYEGFLGCIVAELRRKGDGTVPHALHIRCSGVATGRQFQDAIELNADQPFPVFGKALRESGEVLLILDDLDYNGDGATAPTIDETIEALCDFCPNLSIIRLTALSCPVDVDSIRVGRLDVADTRSYLNKALRPVHLSSVIDYTRVHRVTGGVPIYLDEFIEALDVTDIEGAIVQADAHPIPAGDALHESVVKEIKELQHCAADDMKRTRALLWTLTILEQGESLGAIKRLDGRAPIWPKNATYLQSKGCLESVTITSRFTPTSRAVGTMDGDKILRIPRLVRDYVLSIMTNEEREEIIRNVANLYFSEDWRMGIVRMRRRLAIGTEISTHQSGNELAILKRLLQSPEVYFGSTPSVAFRLAVSYVGQLRSKAFYGEAYEAAKDTLAIVNEMPSVYPKDEVYHIQLLAASCARMVGDREACVKYLQTAMPSVRTAGVKATLADALVNLSMALFTLKRHPEAKVAAQEILEVAPKNSSDYLQATATLAEIDMPRPEAIRFLKALATKAKNLRHYTVADNAILEVVSETDDTEEKLKMLNEIRSRREQNYNFVRATLRRVETLIDSNRQSQLTNTDREDLWFSYHLAYSQRMSSIFDWCHRVCWKYLVATDSKCQLGELYMHSSFVWRLRGESKEELSYSVKLEEEVRQKTEIGSISGIIGYITRRIAALVKASGIA